MLVAYGAIAVSGILAWMGRRNEGTFAAQWYAVAALFLFPWLSSLAQLVLLWTPVRGVSQAVAGAWYAQGVWTLWLAPLALAGAYYVVTKVTGKTLPSYDMAPLGFWTLILVGAWTGGRHLIGGPVPAWVSTVAVVASVVLLVHYLMVGVNLSIAWGTKSSSLGFIRFGLVAYLLAGVLDAVFSFRVNALHAQFTFVEVAFQQLALYGGLSMLFFGAIYFMVPRLTGNAWASANLAIGHKFLVMLGVVALIVALLFGGWAQATDLLNPKTEFADILEHLQVPLLVVSAAQLVLILANFLLLVNFLQTISASVTKDIVALNPIQQSTEASA
jgi:cytochrome c oxidase cbb3-type subunit 1